MRRRPLWIGDDLGAVDLDGASALVDLRRRNNSELIGMRKVKDKGEQGRRGGAVAISDRGGLDPVDLDGAFAAVV